jgi:hypothetical protein
LVSLFVKIEIFLTRTWFYFRTGYGMYLTFVLGVLNTVVVLYYLLIKNVPALQEVFGSFTTFTLIAALIGVPVSVLAGWLHLKGSTAMASEQDIIAEANPYAYKLQPGYLREAFAPLYLEILTLLTRMASREKLLTAEEQAHITALEDKMRTLIQGGYVGKPRRRPLPQ